jgi:hypothetical protein
MCVRETSYIPVCIPPNNRQRCGPFSVSRQLSCDHPGGNPCSRVGFQNSHSTQRSVRCNLSEYDRVTFCFRPCDDIREY